MNYAPVMFISARTGQRVNTVFDKVKEVYETARRRITTGVLNDVLNDATDRLQPPLQGTRRLKIYYATQTGIQPPTFVFFVNDETLMQFSYERYLENYFRKSFQLEGTPVRFILRERKEKEK
jgi:GTP-binding protein